MASSSRAEGITDEARAPRLDGLDGDRPAVRLGDLARDVQPEAHAAIVSHRGAAFEASGTPAPRSASGMPGPSSSTEKTASSPRSARVISTREPAAYLRAFESRFVRSCSTRSRSHSPMTGSWTRKDDAHTRSGPTAPGIARRRRSPPERGRTRSDERDPARRDPRDIEQRLDEVAEPLGALVGALGPLSHLLIDAGEALSRFCNCSWSAVSGVLSSCEAIERNSSRRRSASSACAEPEPLLHRPRAAR